MEGADIDGLDALAAAMQDAGGRLQASTSTVTAALSRSPWVGPDADAARQDWRTYHQPKLDAATAVLLDAVATLHRNANEQRIASGDQPVSYAAIGGALSGGGSGGVNKNSAASSLSRLWKDTEKTVESVAKFEVEGPIEQWRDLAAGYDEVVHSQEFGDVVNSRAFTDVMGSAHVVADITSVAAMIVLPFAPEVSAGLYTAAFAANSVILVGDAAKMANTGKWNAVTLAGDGLSTFGSAAGAGLLGKAAEAANGGSGLKVLLHTDVTQAPKVIASQVEASGVVGEAVIAGTIASGFATGISTTEAEVDDFQKGDWVGAGIDSLGYVDAVATAGGFDDVDAADKVAQTEINAVRAPVASPAAPLTYFLDEEAN